ncbi:MAG: hypothetical protein ABR550_03235, partial [Wenzhouxiangellaceae bacterium]
VIGMLMDGDIVTIDADCGRLDCRPGPQELRRRPVRSMNLAANRSGTGRELFGAMRAGVGDAESGASILFAEG